MRSKHQFLPFGTIQNETHKGPRLSLLHLTHDPAVILLGTPNLDTAKMDDPALLKAALPGLKSGFGTLTYTPVTPVLTILQYPGAGSIGGWILAVSYGISCAQASTRKSLEASVFSHYPKVYHYYTVYVKDRIWLKSFVAILW